MSEPLTADKFAATRGFAMIVGDEAKQGKKTPGHVYVMRQPNGLTSALIASKDENFSPKCDYIDLGLCTFPDRKEQ